MSGPTPLVSRARMMPQGKPVDPSDFKTLRRINSANHARFLTFSCYHNLPLLGADPIRRVFVESLDRARTRHRFLLISWVVMPTHVHLMIMPPPPHGVIRDILFAIKTPFARRVLARWRELDARVLAKIRDASGQAHFWQSGGGYDRNIVSSEEFHEKNDYIHRNPVAAGLVAREVDWPWSSARWYAGVRNGMIECDPLRP